MSEAHSRREQFHTKLKCSRCGADGHAVWEDHGGSHREGPLGALVSISENFIQRAPRSHLGLPEIACKSCGHTHTG
jgi:DNA-directed RNA polymerase subunit RPC12/RpoP